MHRGIATFTPDTGRCPPWLFERMVKLGREMVRVLVAEHGPDEFIRRIADLFPDWPFCATRIEVLGTNGFMYVGRHGGGWQIFASDDKVIESRYGRQGDKWHQDNFVQCIRTRERPNADVEQDPYSALLCHMANISGLVGNRKLRFDPKTETFIDAPEAHKHLKRTHREPCG